MIKRTLYFGSPCYLSKRLEQLVVSFAKADPPKQDPPPIPIEDLGVVVLDNPQITTTQGLLESLIANNVAIVHCNAKHMPIGLVMPFEANGLQSARFKQQIEASEPLKKQLWQQTVAAKIRNQAEVLQKQNKPFRTLLTLAEKVKPGDPENVEAQAAIYYWGRLFPDSLRFRRDPDGDYPNSFLNYGYAILRAVVARALVGAGLLPTLGIHHSNKYNAFCLADDAMEPYRPFVDALVCELMQTKATEKELSKTIKADLLGIATADVWLNDERSPLMVAAHKTAVSLHKCYVGHMRKIAYPTMTKSPQGKKQVALFENEADCGAY